MSPLITEELPYLNQLLQLSNGPSQSRLVSTHDGKSPISVRQAPCINYIPLYRVSREMLIAYTSTLSVCRAVG